MTEYTVTFSAPTAYAVTDIKAKTAKQALKKARAIYDEDPSGLDWCPYDADCKTLDKIEVVTIDNNDEAYWQSEDAALKDTAQDLLDALVDLVERDRAEAVACGFTDDEMTWLEDARRAIAKAKGG